MDELARRDRALDGIEKADELLVPVALHAAASHGSWSPMPPAAGAARANMNRRSGQMRQTATVEMDFDEGEERVPA
jgi:hypothetical protein